MKKALVLTLSAVFFGACNAKPQPGTTLSAGLGACRAGESSINIMLGSLPQNTLADSFVYISGQQVYMPVYDSVFRTDNNYRLGSRILKSWTASDDFMQYTFTLNEGLTFANGKPLTSNALRVMFEPGTKSLYVSDSVRRLVKKVKAVDDRTIEVLLKRPYSKFPSLLSDFRNIVVHEDETLSPWPGGSGAFEVCYRSPKAIIIQRRKSPAAPGLEVQQIRYVVPEAARVDSRYIAEKEISFFPFISVTDIDAVAKNYSRFRFLSQRVKAVVFNVPDPDVRKALATCLDREALIRHPFLSDSSYKYDFMLANGVENFSNGIPVVAACAPYKGPRLKKPVTFISFYDMPGAKEFMEAYLKGWAARANVPLDMETVPTSEIPGRLSDKKYDIAMIGIGPKSPLAEGLFLEFANGGSERSVIGFPSARVNRAYEKYLAAGPSESLNAVREVEKEIRADYLAVPMAMQTLTFYIPKNWINFTQSTSLTGVFDLTHLTIAEK